MSSPRLGIPSSSTQPALINLPLEVKHMIFTELLPSVRENDLAHVPKLATVAECIAPLSCVCKALRQEVVTWYMQVRDQYKFRNSVNFGAIQPDKTTFPLPIINNYRDSPPCLYYDLRNRKEHTHTCQLVDCPGAILKNLFRYPHKVTSNITHLKVILVGYHDTHDTNMWTHNSAALAYARKLLQIERLDVYVCRYISPKLRTQVGSVRDTETYCWGPIPVTGTLDWYTKPTKTQWPFRLTLWVTPLVRGPKSWEEINIEEKAQKWREW